MNTARITEAQKLIQHGGVWVGLDQRLFRKRIERMADLAGDIDYNRRAIPDEDQRAKVSEAIALLHAVAMHYDEKHAWGIYAKEDIECQEVKL
jgi:hypothetical protein